LAQPLQAQEIALNMGPRQPNDLCATLDSVPAARQEVRIIGGLRSPENKGKISFQSDP
jgi:uncharacterized protein YcbK (DUF882 family)